MYDKTDFNVLMDYKVWYTLNNGGLEWLESVIKILNRYFPDLSSAEKSVISNYLHNLMLDLDLPLEDTKVNLKLTTDPKEYYEWVIPPQENEVYWITNVFRHCGKLTFEIDKMSGLMCREKEGLSIYIYMYSSEVVRSYFNALSNLSWNTVTLEDWLNR